MLYLLWGLILGIALNLLPLWQPANAIQFYPEWHGNLNTPGKIQTPLTSAISNTVLPPVITDNNSYVLSGNGKLLNNVSFDKSFISISGNGKYYCRYEKVGSEVEFINSSGERFWKIQSKEYPHLSYNGKLTLLMNGDHSGIRILDINSNEIGVKRINGRFCTVVSFSKYSDFAGIGFLDGSYYIIDVNGELVKRGRFSGKSLIKGIAISSNGNFIGVHYGNNNKDNIRLIDIIENSEYTIPLIGIHLCKSYFCVTNKGGLSFIDKNRIIITGDEGRIEHIIKIPPMRAGASAIDYSNGIFLSSYTGTDGITRLLSYRSDGTVIISKEFTNEAFMSCSIMEQAILLRGSESLYCYSYER